MTPSSSVAAAHTGNPAPCSPASVLRDLWRHRWLLVICAAVASLAAIAPVFRPGESNQLAGNVLLKLGGNSVRGVFVEIPKQVQLRLQQRFGDEGFQSVVRTEPTGSVLLIRFVEADGNQARLEERLQQAARYVIDAHAQKAAELFKQVPKLEIGFANTELLGGPHIETVKRAPIGLGTRLSRGAALGFGIGALLIVLWGPVRKSAVLTWADLPSAIDRRAASRHAMFITAAAAVSAALVVFANGWPQKMTRVSVDMQMGGQLTADGFFPVETLGSVRDRLSALFDSRGFTGVDSVETRFGVTSKFRITFQGSDDVMGGLEDASRYIGGVHQRLLVRWAHLPRPLRPPLRFTGPLAAPVVTATSTRRLAGGEAILGGVLGGTICLLAVSLFSMERRPRA